MLKTFSLDKREEEQSSKTQGTIIFHITDELGDSRTIEGNTFLDEEGIAQGVTTKNKRELPLIEGLFRLEIGESVTITFDRFNSNYDRSLNKTINQIAYDTVCEMEKEKSLLYRLGKKFSNITPTALSSH